MDYEQFFGLKERPFKAEPTGGFFYRGLKAQTLFTSLSVKNPPPLVHLKSAAGLGKSALLKKLHSEFRTGLKVILILNPHFTLAEILRQALADLGRSHTFDAQTPEEALLGYYQNAMADLMDDGYQVLLVVDEIEQMPDETLSELHSLCRLEPAWEGHVSLILSGSDKTRWPEAPDLPADPLILRLKPLDLNETTAYLETRLKAAGGSVKIFSRGAIQAVYDHSAGNPGLINQLAERALIAAWAAGRTQAGPAQVLQAANSLEQPFQAAPEPLKHLGQPTGAAPVRHNQRRQRNRGRYWAVIALFILAAAYLAGRSEESPEITAALEAPPASAEAAAEAVPAAETQDDQAESPSLAGLPPQLLTLPQGGLALVIDQTNENARLWQGGPKGSGLKAEVSSVKFNEAGLYLLGRPKSGPPLVFQFPPAGETPFIEAQAVWPKISTLIPQNTLPIIVAPAKALTGRPSEVLSRLLSAQVKVWVQAQEYRFPDTMAALYAGSFQFFELGQKPKTLERDDFREALDSEAKSSGEVRVTISDPLLMQDPEKSSLAWAVFNIRYTSRLRRDLGVRVLVFEQSLLSKDTWLIVAELWLPETNLLDF